jgi:hypothetical protein
MSLLELTIVVTVVLFLLMSIDLFQRKKFNLLHFLVFFGGSGAIATFLVRPDFLEIFGRFFGVARGADALVYIGIIVLAYFYFHLFNKLTKHELQITRLISATAIKERKASPHITLPLPTTKEPKDTYLFLMRAYNEASVIWEVIDEIIGAGFHKIIIVNDGSRDATAEVIENKQKEHPHSLVIGLHHTINRWPGAANKTLFQFATQYAQSLGADRLVTYDADGQMDIKDMHQFMHAASQHKRDVVIWSRFVAWAKIDDMPLLRRIILRGGRVVTFIFNGVWLTDVSTGYRMYHRNVIGKFQLTSDRFSYQNEIIGTLGSEQLRFTEIPVHIKYTAYSLSKGQSNMSAFKILKELIYKAFFFK